MSKLLSKLNSDDKAELSAKECKICVEALRKQTPKKVINFRDIRDFSGHLYSHCGDCPICGFEKLMSIQTAYCTRCGQCLNWEE